MRKNLTTLLLAAATAALAYAYGSTRTRLRACEAEITDLWHEGQDELQRAELLQDDLACLREKLRDAETEYLSAISKLGMAHGEVARSHDLNRKMRDAQAAAAARSAEMQQSSGWWVWASPRIQPAGPFSDVSEARREAEDMAARYPNQDIFLLSAANVVRVSQSVGGPVWTILPPATPSEYEQALERA